LSQLGREKKLELGKKQEGGELKEIRLTYNISTHDLETRVAQTSKFLSKGNRIRITLPLRGRQKALEGFAREKVATFLTMLGSSFVLKTERELKREPRGLSTIVSCRNKKQEKQ